MLRLLLLAALAVYGEHSLLQIIKKGNRVQPHIHRVPVHPSVLETFRQQVLTPEQVKWDQCDFKVTRHPGTVTKFVTASLFKASQQYLDNFVRASLSWGTYLDHLGEDWRLRIYFDKSVKKMIHNTQLGGMIRSASPKKSLAAMLPGMQLSVETETLLQETGVTDWAQYFKARDDGSLSHMDPTDVLKFSKVTRGELSDFVLQLGLSHEAVEMLQENNCATTWEAWIQAVKDNKLVGMDKEDHEKISDAFYTWTGAFEMTDDNSLIGVLKQASKNPKIELWQFDCAPLVQGTDGYENEGAHTHKHHSKYSKDGLHVFLGTWLRFHAMFDPAVDVMLSHNFEFLTDTHEAETVKEFEAMDSKKYMVYAREKRYGGNYKACDPTNKPVMNKKLLAAWPGPEWLPGNKERRHSIMAGLFAAKKLEGETQILPLVAWKYGVEAFRVCDYTSKNYGIDEIALTYMLKYWPQTFARFVKACSADPFAVGESVKLVSSGATGRVTAVAHTKLTVKFQGEEEREESPGDVQRMGFVSRQACTQLAEADTPRKQGKVFEKQVLSLPMILRESIGDVPALTTANTYFVPLYKQLFQQSKSVFLQTPPGFVVNEERDSALKAIVEGFMTEKFNEIVSKCDIDCDQKDPEERFVDFMTAKIQALCSKKLKVLPLESEGLGPLRNILEGVENFHFCTASQKPLRQLLIDATKKATEGAGSGDEAVIRATKEKISNIFGEFFLNDDYPERLPKAIILAKLGLADLDRQQELLYHVLLRMGMVTSCDWPGFKIKSKGGQLWTNSIEHVIGWH